VLKAHLCTLHARVAVLVGTGEGKDKLYFLIFLPCPVLSTLNSRSAALAPLCASQVPFEPLQREPKKPLLSSPELVVHFVFNPTGFSGLLMRTEVEGVEYRN